MGDVLEVLLAGRSLDQALQDGAEHIQRIGQQSQVRVFRVTKDTGLVTTELYPNSMQILSFIPEAKKS